MGSRRFPWGVAIAVALLLTGIDTALTVSGAVNSWNQTATPQIHQLEKPWLNPPMIALTYLGTWQALLAITLAVAIWTIVKGRHLDPWLLFGVYVASLIVQEVTKVTVRSPRPSLILPPPPITPLETFSYVSGHSLQAMAVLGFIGVVAWGLIERRWIRAVLLVVVVLLIAGIGFSRLYLGLHWANDVLGGYLYGVALLLVASWLRAACRRHQ
jgi:undecaprenyl-diphosphatase